MSKEGMLLSVAESSEMASPRKQETFDVTSKDGSVGSLGQSVPLRLTEKQPVA